ETQDKAADTPKTPATSTVEVPEGPFLGMQPTDTPTLLAPDFLSRPLTEYNGTFSPDGKTFFYTSELKNGYICFTELGPDNRWTKPRVAPFSGIHSEYDPLFKPDGKRLYFSSERPVEGQDGKTRTNIWYVDRQEGGWSAPQHVPLTGNGDYYSSLTRSGTIYFNVWSKGDLFKAVPNDTGYAISALPEHLNSRSDAGDPFISPDEDYLIYRAYYKEGFGRGDLYISFRDGEKWTEPQNMGEKVNSKAHEMCPSVSPDGRFFIWASTRMSKPYPELPGGELDALLECLNSVENGNLNIYYMSADFIEDLRAEALGK
ncbi:MAG: hypothetical protein AAF570_19965, partial [Bacteroidota bacterium]